MHLRRQVREVPFLNTLTQFWDQNPIIGEQQLGTAEASQLSIATRRVRNVQHEEHLLSYTASKHLTATPEPPAPTITTPAADS